MSEVKNTKNQAAQAEDILREPSGAQKDSGTGGKKEDCDRNIRYRGNVYQETLGQLSVPLKDDITVMWKDGKACLDLENGATLRILLSAIPMTYGMIRGWGRYMTIISIMPWYIHRMV